MKAEIDRRRAEQQAKKDRDNAMRAAKLEAEHKSIEDRQAEIARREQENVQKQILQEK